MQHKVEASVEGSRKFGMTVEPISMSALIEDDDSSSSDIFQAPRLVTPTSCQTSLQAVTPDSVCEDLEEPMHQTDLESEVEEARWDALQSAQALEHLVQGIRAVKRILERPSASKDATKGPNSRTTASDDINIVSALSDKLYGVLGSDLLGLLNSANMVREHANLAEEEASVLVHDVNKCQEEAAKSKNRSQRAEQVSCKLYKENFSLKQDMKKLRLERRALVKEVKSLRAQAEETRKFDNWRLLEDHLFDSVALHEKILKTPTIPKTCSFEDALLTPTAIEAEGKENISFNNGKEGQVMDPNINNSENPPGTATEQPPVESNTQKAGTTVENKPKPKRGIGFGEGLAGFGGAFSSSVGFEYAKQFQGRRQEKSKPFARSTDSSTNGPKEVPTKQCALPARARGSHSPIPSLDEVTADSWSEARTSDMDVLEQAAEEDAIMPSNVAFDAEVEGAMPSHLASPLVSPNESPAGIVIRDLKPICNPHILRTLAIPLDPDTTTIEYKFPSRRICVGQGLYEC